MPALRTSKGKQKSFAHLAQPADAAAPKSDHQTQSQSVKDEIKDAIDAANRSMSKSHATLRRLRSRLKY